MKLTKYFYIIISLVLSINSTCFGKNIEQKTVTSILTLEINSPITPATFDYLQSGFKKLSNTSHQAILIKMNTPGGLVTTTKEILTLFGSADFPVIVWVAPEGASATSAGAIISSGAHLLYMSEGTNIGAATPIQMSGDIKQKDARSKAINDLVALVKGLSEVRGRNGKFFGEMISKGKSFSARDAKKKNIINGIANTKDDLIASINGKVISIKGKKIKIDTKTSMITTHKMSTAQEVLAFFANPAMAYILFLIGAALIYLEFQAPGGFVAGSIGAVCLLLAGIGFHILPLNVGALALIILAIVLFVLEIYITSYGILSLAGVGCLITGSLLLFKTENAYLEVSTTLILSTSLAIVAFMGFVGFFFIKDIRNKDSNNFFSLTGLQAEVIEIVDNRPGHVQYTVKVRGERWKAVSNEEFRVGDFVDITDQDKTTITLTINKNS